GSVHRRDHRQVVMALDGEVMASGSQREQRQSDGLTTTLFHCSDLHFGHPAVPEQYEAIEAIIAERRFDVVAISGDLSQRSRSGEFQRARVFLQHAKRYSEVIVVPGNHDVAWWKAPLGFGD